MPKPIPDRERIQAARNRLDVGAALNREDLAILLGVSLKSVDRMVAAGTLPAPDLVMNLRCVRWTAKSVRRFIDGDGAAA